MTATEPETDAVTETTETPEAAGTTEPVKCGVPGCGRGITLDEKRDWWGDTSRHPFLCPTSADLRHRPEGTSRAC